MPAHIELLIEASEKESESLFLISFAALLVKVMASTCHGGGGLVINSDKIGEML